MPMERDELCEQLSTIDQSLHFLILIIAGVLLSFKATTVQREALCDQIRGEEGDTSAVYPLRHTANSLIVGALGFFLCLAIRNWRERDTSDCVASRSAHSNLWAALLVFAAAVIRFDDLEFTRQATAASVQ